MSIPKIIHYCWFGNGKKNELVERCIESWKKYCPDCEIVEWNETNYDVSKNLYMKQAYDAKRWGFVSDYARLDIIFNYGGIYLDTDVEIVRSIDEIFAGQGFFGFEKPMIENEGNYYVNTGQGFGAEPYNELVLQMRNVYEKVSFCDSEGKENLTTCPYYNTIVLEKFGLKKDNSLQNINGLIIYPDDFFCPYNWKEKKMVITDRTFAVHHFNASWLSEKVKRRSRIERYMDGIIHLPNRMLKVLLGEKKYEILKKKVKRVER